MELQPNNNQGSLEKQSIGQIYLLKKDLLHIIQYIWAIQQWLYAHWRGWDPVFSQSMRLWIPQQFQPDVEDLWDFWTDLQSTVKA